MSVRPDSLDRPGGPESPEVPDASARPWSARLFGTPARTWRVALVGAFLVWMPEVFIPWNWRPPGTSALRYAGDHVVFYLTYVLLGTVCWSASVRLESALSARWPDAPWLRFLAAAVPIVAAILGFYAALYFVVLPWAIGLYMPLPVFWRWGIHVSMLALIFHGWRVSHRVARVRGATLGRAAQEAAQMEATLSAAEIALLEMQVEPHFLFNTLAHVRRDLRQAPAEAARMLAALIDYLERAGPALRREDWTIGDELGLVETYLALVRQRFGARLRFSIEAAAALHAERLPALAIATLVENAVQHGLAPKAEGGELRIRVAFDPEAPAGARGAAPPALRITVVDDGVGLQPSQGHGLGLATVRARLRSAFGARASLTLESGPAVGGCGVCAAIRIAAHA